MSLRPVLVCTAGHIDHGKTRLVAALTGINTDRLPEEKSRGISIDLGFAHWEQDGFRFGVVDVPGHERFVRNMVAGVTGVQVGMLVVAADDGIMPQTREHLDIMHLLGLKAGVVAVSKVDLVDTEMQELVCLEIGELIRNTFLENCEVVAVSAVTGKGLNELKQALVRAAGSVSATADSVPFRMPIDRVFSLPGHGTIVTGSCWSGSVSPGDLLELLPEGQSVRVRSVECHGRQVESALGAGRTAINISGVKAETIDRGHELAAPGFLQPTKRMLVEIRCLERSNTVIRNRSTLRLHLGAAEVDARVSMHGPELVGGATVFAELRTKTEIVATWGQRFILRQPSPAVTIAGGRVLDPVIPAQKRIRNLEEYARELASPRLEERLAARLESTDGEMPEKIEALAFLGIPPQEYEAAVGRLLTTGRIRSLDGVEGRQLISENRMQQLGKAVMNKIREELARTVPRRTVERKRVQLLVADVMSGELVDLVLKDLVQRGELTANQQMVGLAGDQIVLSKRQVGWQLDAVKIIEVAGLAPPTLAELCQRLNATEKDIRQIMSASVEQGLVVEFSSDFWVSPDALEQAKESVKRLYGEQSEATLAMLRDRWQNTRKHAVPMAEYFDMQGYTERKGDLRRRGPNL